MKNNNFNLRTRCPKKAAKFALRRGSEGCGTNGTLLNRFSLFLQFCRIKWLEQVTKDMVTQYGNHVKRRFELGEIKIATAHNYISAVNTVMSLVRGDHQLRIFACRDIGLPNRNNIAHAARPIPRIPESLSPRIKALLGLMEAFGLRPEEACKLCAKDALKAATSTNKFELTKGSKGGRPRTVIVDSESKFEALRQASEIQSDHHSMIPKQETYKAFHSRLYQRLTSESFIMYDFRHNWACQRYKSLVGYPPPVMDPNKHNGQNHHQNITETLSISLEEAKSLDKKVRHIIAQELGHNRLNITNSYLGK